MRWLLFNDSPPHEAATHWFGPISHWYESTGWDKGADKLPRGYRGDLQSAFLEKMAPSFNIASRRRTERFERTVMREQAPWMRDSRGRVIAYESERLPHL